MVSISRKSVTVVLARLKASVKVFRMALISFSPTVSFIEIDMVLLSI